MIRFPSNKLYYESSSYYRKSITAINVEIYHGVSSESAMSKLFFTGPNIVARITDQAII